MWTIHFLYGGGGDLLELPSEDGGGGADGACLRGVEAGREATGPTLLLPLDFVAGTERDEDDWTLLLILDSTSNAFLTLLVVVGGGGAGRLVCGTEPGLSSLRLYVATKLVFFVSFSSTLSSVLACTRISLSVSVTSRLIVLTKKRERKEWMNHVVTFMYIQLVCQHIYNKEEKGEIGGICCLCLLGVVTQSQDIFTMCNVQHKQTRSPN